MGKTEISKYIKSKNNQLGLLLGSVTELEKIGEGGNGLVYSGVQNGKTIALKFLAESSMKKLIRFKAEYFNVMNLNVNKLIVKYINYEEIAMDNDIEIPTIIMKKYAKSLNQYRKDTVINYENFVRLFQFLLNSLNLIHRCGIVHRDIKPENILVDEEGEFVLSDFGIANYDPELFMLKAETKENDRMANYAFSAPEQSQRDVKAHPAMDIYALGQLCQWYVYGVTHKGTGRKRITEKIQGEVVEIIDIIINKCIANDPPERYQSIEEITKHLERLRDERRKPDAFTELGLFSDALRRSCPEAYSKIKYISDPVILKRLIDNIVSKEYQEPLWYVAGYRHNEIQRLNYDEQESILRMNEREMRLCGAWIYTESNQYDDLLIFDTEKLEYFEVNGEECCGVVIINDKHIMKSDAIRSGYVEIEGKSCALEDLNIDEIYIDHPDRYYAIGTIFHCAIISENEDDIRDLQNEELTDEKIEKLLMKICRKKHDQVLAVL